MLPYPSLNKAASIGSVNVFTASEYASGISSNAFLANICNIDVNTPGFPNIDAYTRLTMRQLTTGGRKNLAVVGSSFNWNTMMEATLVCSRFAAHL